MQFLDVQLRNDFCHLNIFIENNYELRKERKEKKETRLDQEMTLNI